MAEEQTRMNHVAILAHPGMGHLIPFAELTKRLVDHHNLSITFIVPTISPPSKAHKSVVESLGGSVNSIFLPPVSLHDVPKDAKVETIASLSVLRSLPSLREILRSLSESSKLVALVVDIFCTDAFDVAREFNVSPYIFFPSNAMTLSLFLYLPELDEKVSCEYRELEETVKIPGSVAIQGKDLLDPIQDRKNEAYKYVLHQAKRYRLAEGIMVNSFLDLEGGALSAFREDPGKPLVYLIGPLVNLGSDSDESECLRWLHDRPHGSVVYVSFGSAGILSYHQMTELALGLEMSEQRFLWVVRATNDEDPFDNLPKGFLDRTRGRGLVVPSWAPQAQVLRHGSTGGFVTHCGWNSTLESMVNGVPLVAWPLYAEQKMNAVLLTQEIKVALSLKVSENGLIGREEIAKVVKDLMEGEEGRLVRNRMKELKDSAAKALSRDGSSTKALPELVMRWKK
ncbi:hypothetical protein K2173_025217 [Erythroxylum novogranatense]|uniref:Glycosyltransferase n=1 Tax=Erythroxylum novogranatense TaxID=1862640 RepID=A0AAV8UDA2_9ROSI|nr:hypothetical protein K2173_025217 [Erythroxylum novogranatense]